jgi:hypothetical protein
MLRLCGKHAVDLRHDGGALSNVLFLVFSP